MTGGKMDSTARGPRILPEGEALVLSEWEQGLMFVFGLVLGLVGLLLLLSSIEEHFQMAAPTVGGLVCIGSAAFFFQSGRAGLVVEKDGVTLRGIVRRRHWAWHDIEGFEIQFVLFFPPLKMNLKDDRHVRAPGFRGRTAKDRALADQRVAELNRRVETSATSSASRKEDVL